ncbi:hypothetical protein [Rhizobium leguminosarum]|uniref:hypothetical protein n=1 Tax=Rhizobium leguminosarum TaxID=384 RepID=UPI001C976733|nr:hypothetical protein [Rhizobium leguminosarum]MBY5439064.1 hypothetical protein [Rhizobium leguminosarum]
MTDPWQRHEAEARISEVLNAAKTSGPQNVQDMDGTFSITFSQSEAGLEHLFSKPGPLQDDDLDT